MASQPRTLASRRFARMISVFGRGTMMGFFGAALFSFIISQMPPIDDILSSYACAARLDILHCRRDTCCIDAAGMSLSEVPMACEPMTAFDAAFSHARRLALIYMPDYFRPALMAFAKKPPRSRPASRLLLFLFSALIIIFFRATIYITIGDAERCIKQQHYAGAPRAHATPPRKVSAGGYGYGGAQAICTLEEIHTQL